jgi:hypothetical protein
MEKLYRAKGGEDDGFNLSPVRLDEADIKSLEEAVRANQLPHTTGFFFGESGPGDKHHDLEFIRLARQVMWEGKRVFYLAWW